MKDKYYYSMSVDEIFKRFRTSDNGLTSREVKKE